MHTNLQSLEDGIIILEFLLEPLKDLIALYCIRQSNVKTQKACEQGWEANIVTKIKQTTYI